MSKAKCMNCNKEYSTKVKVLKNNKSHSLLFCCYDCYLKFWKNIKSFEPLKEI